MLFDHLVCKKSDKQTSSCWVFFLIKLVRVVVLMLYSLPFYRTFDLIPPNQLQPEQKGTKLL